MPLKCSIESRPQHIELRQEAGRGEIDLVVGGKGKGSVALLTLIERKTRKLIIRKLKNKTQTAVIRTINGSAKLKHWLQEKAFQ
ncbi:MAG: hypothetical protein OES84_03655 [Kiritimatiellaceae bacterium]|nr:hypothetical protein [Kiritimatiellaceae bacterium]